MKTEIEVWKAYRGTRDPALRERIIERNLFLVKYAAVRIAGRLPSHLSLGDLYSAGLLGYLRAVEDFDPDRGVQFALYATRRIRGSIFDELRRLDWVPRAIRRKIRDAERAIDSLFRRLGRQPMEDEVAAELSIGLEDYQRLLGYGLTLLSLDAPVGGKEEALTPLDSLEDSNAVNPLLSLAAKERCAILGRIIQGLPERERQVLSLYYYEELTMQEVGQALGVTESRVSQLHSSAILRIRSALRRHRISVDDLVLTRTAGLAGRR
jgi:RNA polymerase sigma factor for flagellar operon FliA